MPKTVVESTLDVALWFLDRARLEDNYLQAQKLQRLLYLAQGYYAAKYYGRKLMPATFVAHEMGPMEPNVYRLFELGRPQIPNVGTPPEVEDFLQLLWRQFGQFSTERLGDLVRKHDIYIAAMQAGEGEEIGFETIKEFFGRKEKPAEKVRTADGRTVTKWLPTKQAGSRFAR